MTRGVLLWYTLKKTQRIDFALVHAQENPKNRLRIDPKD